MTAFSVLWDGNFVLSAIVIFMLWLYVCMYILLMGGEINLLTGRIRRL